MILDTSHDCQEEQDNFCDTVAENNEGPLETIMNTLLAPNTYLAYLAYLVYGNLSIPGGWNAKQRTSL